MKRSKFHKVWLSSMGLFSTILIVLALSVTVIRIMIPSVPAYRQDLQDWLTEYLGHPVSIENLVVKLNGLDVIIKISKAQILSKDGTTELFQLQDLRVSVDTVEAIKKMKIEPETIDLIGLDISVERDLNGKFVLQGLSSFEEVFSKQEQGKSATPQVKKTFIEEFSDVKTNIRIIDSTLLFRDAITGKAMLANRINLILGRDEDGPTLAGAIQLPSAMGDRVRFYSKMAKRQGQSMIPSVEFYLQGTRMSLHNWPVISELTEYPKPTEGSLDFQLWGEFDSQNFREVQGRILARDIGLESTNKKGETKNLKLDTIDGDFAITTGVYGWKMDAANLKVVKNDNAWGAEELSLWTHLGETVDQRDIGISFNGIEFNDSYELVSIVPGVNESLKKKVKDAALSAHLDSGVVFVSLEGDQLKSIATDVNVDQFSVGTGSQRFYSKGINYRVLATADNGLVRISTPNGDAELTTADLFRNPFAIKNLDGDISWSIDEHGFTLRSYGVDVLSQEASAKVRFDYTSARDSFGVLDLQAQINEGKSAGIHNFYPTKIMDTELIEWLDNAFLSGNINGGSILVYGQLENFPYNNKNGIFEVSANVENVDLNFAPEWENIKQAKADLLFHNNGMNITFRDGRIGKSVKIKSGYARIKNFSYSPLDISAQVEGDSSDYVSFLRNSPLPFASSEAMKNTKMSGQMALDINLKIPLIMGRVSDTQVNGDLEYKGVDYRLDGSFVQLDDLTGSIRFNELGAKDGQLEAVMFDRKVNLNVYGKKNRVAGVDTIIEATANLDPKVLPLAGMRPVFDKVVGESLWNVKVKLPNPLAAPYDRGLAINAKTDLVGTSILLPQPVAKVSSKEKRDIQLSLKYLESDEVDIGFNIGRIGSGKIRFEDDSFNKLDRGQILLGSKKATMPRVKGLQVYGAVKEFNVDLWRNSLEPVVPFTKGEAEPKGEAEFQDFDFSDFKVDVGKLVVANRDFNNITTKLNKKSKGWKIDLSSDKVKGTLWATKKAGKIKKLKGIFERLDIQAQTQKNVASKDAENNGKQKKETAKDEQDVVDGVVEITPQEIPALDFVVQDMSVDGKKLGSLNFVSSPVPAGMQFERIDITGDVVDLKANGSWLKSEKTGEKTNFQAQMNAKNVGAILDIIGMEGQVSNGEGKANYDLFWQGSPWEVNIATISGHVDYEIHDGQLLKIEPGFGRMIGIFSIETLWRRMIFDFRDIFSEGFAFDTLKGTVDARDGNAYIKDFMLRGVAATVEMEGRIGLRDKDLDQILTITPKASSALPLVGGLAAGTGVGVGILILQKVFQSPLEKLSQVQYKVTGPWDDPKMEKHEVKQGDLEYDVDEVLSGEKDL